MFRAIIRFTLPLVILGGSGALGWWFYVSKPTPDVMEVAPPLVRVAGTTLKKTVYPVVAKSQGAVQPRTRTVLTSEVAGRVVVISPQFRPGGFFAEGEVLVKLDPVDYEVALVTANAAVAEAEATLIDEQARAEQALEGWKALGRKGEPSLLLTRGHQVARAEASVASAKALVRRAERDLERTELRAPYAGQVLRQTVDIGQVIGAGADIGEIFAIDYVEVRLPIPEREMAFLKLPHLHRDQTQTLAGSEVSLLANEGGRPSLWEGQLVRVEGAVDPGTRQTIAVAQVNDPFGRREDQSAPLKIGQFVEAEIIGVPLADVFVLPRAAVRAGNELILITKENRLRRLSVTPLAGDDRHLVISALDDGGPREGDVLCVTPIPFPVDGARVLPTIDGQTERPGMAGTDGAASKGAKGKRPERPSES